MNDVTQTSIQQLAINATERLFDNLAGSDFVTHCGAHGINELRRYGADIAGDIYTVFAGEPVSQNQREELVRAFPDA